MTRFSQLIIDEVLHQLMKCMNLNVKILYKRCKQWQKSFRLSMITLSLVLNMYVLAVINYGIGHLSESVKQTNILNVSETLLMYN